MYWKHTMVYRAWKPSGPGPVPRRENTWFRGPAVTWQPRVGHAARAADGWRLWPGPQCGSVCGPGLRGHQGPDALVERDWSKEGCLLGRS